MITSDEGDGDMQPLWLSDGPASAELWSRLRAEHVTSGLWPLLLDSRTPGEGEFRPWASGELFPESMSSPDAHDPAELLARWWQAYTRIDEDDDPLAADDRHAVTAPFGSAWPGTAPARTLAVDPDVMAAHYAQIFTAQRPLSRLGLVAARCGADALAAVGWDGPANYDNDTATYSAVIRGWEQRFGVRVVAVGSDTLHLSVAAPPASAQDALLVAAEHFAFCPDTIWQGARPHTLAAYAERIVDVNCWEFWWD
ncbi:DUF4253 domain-containing protein [Streptomyces sp. NPDC058301]|uniref:DUF4253 domain-containing protein n=1 Tax=Streptomyces sp. NPDC058301 TaxID=3346436 RepID=UPI0036EC0847